MEETLRKTNKTSRFSHQSLDRVSRVVNQTGIPTLIGNIVDRMIDLLSSTENFLNARSNINAVDTFMSTFNQLILSRGISAVNVYYQIFSNIFVKFDAIAQFVRGTENRIIVRLDEAAQLAEGQAQKRNDSEEDVEKRISSLKHINAQLAEFRKNINTWICRQATNIAENGISLERDFRVRQIDCPSLLDWVNLEGKEDYETGQFQGEEEQDLAITRNHSTEDTSSLAENELPDEQ